MDAEKIDFAGQRIAWGLKSTEEDYPIVYDIIEIFREKELTIDRAFRVLEDTRSTLPRIAKFTKIR